MRKDLTIYTLAILLGFVMGLFTCKTCTKAPDCPPVIEPLEGGKIVDSDTTVTIKKDSARTHKVEPVRVTLPTLAAGQTPSIIYKPVPVYMPADTAAIIAQYKGLYEEFTALKEYDNTYPFGGDTVRIKQAIQGNDLWEQNVFLTRSYPTITQLMQAKARNSVWWGAGGYWRDSTPGLKTGFMFLHKKGWALEGEAGIDTRGEKMYEVGGKWKIGRN